MVKEAKENEDADKKRKEEVDLKNEVDQLIFTTDKTLKELEGKVSEDEVKKAQDARDALKKAQDDNNIDEMKAKKDDLNKIVQDLSVKLYQQAQEAQGSQAGADGSAAGNTDSAKSGDDNTVDGDFEDLDKDKDKK
jgi:molecular chaperone DnaK